MSGSHRHSWQTRSRHSTSDGVIAYQWCHCGRWRILGSAESESVLAAGS